MDEEPIYLVVQNLHRSMRYKKENCILVGLIPGPKEPKLTTNSFLQPLVQELKELWQGVTIPCPSHPLKKIFVRAALTCCARDIPATRKLCGFVGHSANLGCSKCYKDFPVIRHGDSICDAKRDYSGYNREHWPVRNTHDHREQAYQHLNAQTKSQQKHIEKQYGLRHSALFGIALLGSGTFFSCRSYAQFVFGHWKTYDASVDRSRHFIQERFCRNRANCF